MSSDAMHITETYKFIMHAFNEPVLIRLFALLI